jgi:hypothetical protein
MSGKERRDAPGSNRGGSAPKRIIATTVAPGATAYVRTRDLPRLPPL